MQTHWIISRKSNPFLWQTIKKPPINICLPFTKKKGIISNRMFIFGVIFFIDDFLFFQKRVQLYKVDFFANKKKIDKNLFLVSFNVAYFEMVLSINEQKKIKFITNQKRSFFKWHRFHKVTKNNHSHQLSGFWLRKKKPSRPFFHKLSFWLKEWLIQRKIQMESRLGKHTNHRSFLFSLLRNEQNHL